ncbi:MAG: universal stress protein [Planctomycetes bacterium]|nr:universal stress protein [Planctomycetota bacterium]
MATQPLFSPPPFERILFCTDFSENADFAFGFLVDIARQNPNRKFYLLHVVPESEAQFWKSYIYEVEDVDQKAKSDIDQRIQQNYRSKMPAGADFAVEFRIGKDYQEILTFAEEKNIDLIILGRQGKGAFQKAFFGNVTEKVARHASCAVMIIPLSYKEKLSKPR